jgi:hypothetical protein
LGFVASGYDCVAGLEALVFELGYDLQDYVLGGEVVLNEVIEEKLQQVRLLLKALFGQFLS